MKKFCCLHFQANYETENEFGPNIRVVKLDEKYGFKGKNRYRVLLTCGYTDKISDKVSFIILNYCPSCGKKLTKLYCKDEYVNESNHP